MTPPDIQPELKLRKLWLLIGLALVSLVIYLSLTSSPVETSLGFPYEDKLYHAFAYFTLMFWFGLIYHDISKRIMLAVLFVVMGLLMEYMQSFDVKRMAEFADMVANAAGVLAGLFLTMGRLRHLLYRIEGLMR